MSTAEPTTQRFVPVGVTARYGPPRATVGRDRDASWLRRARPIVLAHRWIFGTSLILSFVGLVIQVVVPFLLGRAIDDGLAPHHHGALAPYVWAIVGAGVLFGVVSFVSRNLLLRTAYAIEYDLRAGLFEHLSRMSFSFYDRVQSGQLISRANSDIRSVQMYLTFAPSIFVQCGMAVVAFVAMLFISVPLALVAMVVMPVVVWSSIKARQVLFPVSWLIQSRLAEVATIVDENINGVRVVKSFASEPEQLRTLAKAADRVQWANIKDADLRARWTPAIENVPRLSLVLVLLLGGYMVIHGHTQLGTIVTFNFYVLLVQPPFRMLGMIIMMGQRAAASASRIYELLDEEPEIVEQPGATDLRDCRGHVRFEHVAFDYADGTPVLRDFELVLRPGETVAMVGRTGAGKSTVARLLDRFYDVDAGAVRIDGRDIRELTLASLRHHVGIVLDEPFLFSVSVRENIAFGRPDATLEEVVAAARAAAADEFITDLAEGYDTVIGERGYTLSGGQRQRIAIARTLLMNPPILVLDDSTSAIDVQVEQRIHESLRALLAERTTLIIAHRLSTIGLADRVVLLDDGHIVAEGTHSELLEREPRYVEILGQLEADERLPGDEG